MRRKNDHLWQMCFCDSCVAPSLFGRMLEERKIRAIVISFGKALFSKLTHFKLGRVPNGAMSWLGCSDGFRKTKV